MDGPTQEPQEFLQAFYMFLSDNHFIHSWSNWSLSVYYVLDTLLPSVIWTNMSTALNRQYNSNGNDNDVEAVYWGFMLGQDYTKSFNKSFILLNPPHNPANRYYYYSPLTGDQTEAQDT